MRSLANILFLLTAATAPFVMPPSAVVCEGKAEGGGWRQSGEMPMSYRQTRAQFASRFAAAGWHHKHDVPIAKARTVESWERGGETLTFMTWGIAPDKTGFSWGVSQKEEYMGRSKKRENYGLHKTPGFEKISETKKEKK